MNLTPIDGGSIDVDDLTWLGSREGVATARTGTLTGFTGDVLSGTPVTEDADGFYVAYDGTNLAGFVIHGVTVAAGTVATVAILDRGRINTENLPVDFTPPADHGRFAFVPNPPAAGE